MKRKVLRGKKPEKSNLLKNAKHNSLQMQFSSAYKQSYGIDDKKGKKKKKKRGEAGSSPIQG